MTIFIVADHRGFELKNIIIDYLQSKDIRIIDLGAFDFDPNDDYPDYAQKLAQTITQNPADSLGIAICGSGVGMTIALNRFKNIRCGLGFNKDQVKHIKENDHINVLALPADFLKNGESGYQEAKDLVDIFLQTNPKKEDRYLRRIKKIDQI